MTSKNGNKPATQAQLKAVKNALKTDIQTVEKTLKADIQTVEKTLKADIQTVEKTLKADIQTVEKTLKADIQRLAKAVVAIDAKVDRMAGTLRTEMAQGFNRVTSVIDSFLGRLETYARESVTFPKTLDAHGETLKNHDGRLAVLESKR